MAVGTDSRPERAEEIGHADLPGFGECRESNGTGLECRAFKAPCMTVRDAGAVIGDVAEHPGVVMIHKPHGGHSHGRPVPIGPFRVEVPVDHPESQLAVPHQAEHAGDRMAIAPPRLLFVFLEESLGHVPVMEVLALGEGFCHGDGHGGILGIPRGQIGDLNELR
jgi:hypothetical protein